MVRALPSAVYGADATGAPGLVPPVTNRIMVPAGMVASAFIPLISESSSSLRLDGCCEANWLIVVAALTVVTSTRAGWTACAEGSVSGPKVAVAAVISDWCLLHDGAGA